MKKFIDRVEQLSKKGIAYPIGIKHYGKVGKHLEDILVENPHTKNESDMVNLELKTKHIEKGFKTKKRDAIQVKIDALKEQQDAI